jgi:uncharacterized protein (DUF1330 family)
MPKAYWIGAYDAIDYPDKLKAYAEGAGPALIEHGGRILARGGRSVTFEGTEKLRVVVVEFPNLAAAEACYNSDAYRAAHAKLEDGGVRDLYVVEGVE